MKCINPKWITIKYPIPKLPFLTEYEKENEGKKMLIPCGKCLGCKTQYAIDWAKRCVQQTRTSGESYFLTLTYDDNKLPLTLQNCANDMTKFIKNLRKHKQFIKLKYLYVIERGATTNRLHIHALMWNIPLPDKIFYKISGTNPLFISPKLTQLWNNGHIVIGDLNTTTAFYCLKYSYKEINGQTVLKRQSQGIGKDWFYKNINWAKELKNKYYNKLANKLLDEKEKLKLLKNKKRKWLLKNNKQLTPTKKEIKELIEKNKSLEETKIKRMNKIRDITN